MSDHELKSKRDADDERIGCTEETYSSFTRLPVVELRQHHLRNGSWQGRKALEMDYLDEQGMLVSRRYRIAVEGDRFRWRKGDTPIPYGLWKLAEARKRGFVILVEGESDCHTLWHHGLPALGIPGASTWRDEWGRHFERFERIYFVREPDEASTRLLTKLFASELRDRIWVVELDGFKDPSELHRHDPKGFSEEWEKAKAAAIPLAELCIGDSSAIKISELLDLIGDPPAKPSTKEIEEYLDRFQQSVLDNRTKLTGPWKLLHAELARRLSDAGIRKPDAIAKETLAGLENLRVEEETESEPDREIDPEIEETAERLLRFDNLLDFASTTMTRGGLLGEGVNRRVLFLSAIGGLVGVPLHIAIKGSSSGGKNMLANAVLRLLPQDKVLALTGMSKHALEYRGGVIEGVLLIDEAEGQEDASYQIRIAMSEGRVSRATVNKIGGTLIAQDLEIEIRASILTTTTAVALHPENETRMLDLYIDDSEALTREVLSAVADAAEGATNKIDPRELLLWRTAIGKLRAHDVIIPYAHQLTKSFPAALVRARRDINKVMGLIKNCALLHQYTRARNEMGLVVASRDDYSMVLPLIQAVLGPSMSGVSPRARAIYLLLKEMAAKKPGPVRRIDLEQEAGKCRLASRDTVHRWVRYLTDQGFVESEVVGRAITLWPVKDPTQEPIALPAPEDLILPDRDPGTGYQEN